MPPYAHATAAAIASGSGALAWSAEQGVVEDGMIYRTKTSHHFDTTVKKPEYLG